MIDISDISNFLDYNPETGFLIWKAKWNSKQNNVIGKRAGYLGTNGYRYITYKKKVFLEARLIWYICYGKFPDFEIDHINRIKDDNRLCNLREATRSQQIINSKRKRIKNFDLENYPGVIKVGDKYRAHTKKNNKYIVIAVCDTPKQAHEEYRKYHKQNNNHTYIRT